MCRALRATLAPAVIISLRHAKHYDETIDMTYTPYCKVLVTLLFMHCFILGIGKLHKYGFYSVPMAYFTQVLRNHRYTYVKIIGVGK